MIGLALLRILVKGVRAYILSKIAALSSVVILGATQYAIGEAGYQCRLLGDHELDCIFCLCLYHHQAFMSRELSCRYICGSHAFELVTIMG